MKNRIKEQQLYLFADRIGASTMRANELRLWLSSVAYVLVNARREFGLKGTELSQTQSHTMGTKLFKIGASNRLTVRKLWISMHKANPYQAIFFKAIANIRAVVLTKSAWSLARSGKNLSQSSSTATIHLTTVRQSAPREKDPPINSFEHHIAQRMSKGSPYRDSHSKHYSPATKSATTRPTNKHPVRIPG